MVPDFRHPASLRPLPSSYYQPLEATIPAAQPNSYSGAASTSSCDAPREPGTDPESRGSPNADSRVPWQGALSAQHTTQNFHKDKTGTGIMAPDTSRDKVQSCPEPSCLSVLQEPQGC